LIRDTSVYEGVHITLDATAVLPNQTTYHWSGQSTAGDFTINSTNIHNPIRENVPPGEYTVILRDSAGCERPFTVNITLKPDDIFSEPTLVMPNVFTPNGIGDNNFFKPIQVSNVFDFHLRIYNRWGRQVSEFSKRGEMDLSWEGWDGRSGSSEVAEGVYFWVVKYKDLRGRNRQARGTVTLLR
jgi:gliding motility-associated-like protein